MSAYGASSAPSRWRKCLARRRRQAPAAFSANACASADVWTTRAAACLAGIEAAERSDHMYRDTFRAISLCALGRTALDQGDTAAAHAAFTQVIAHIKGRERTLGGGHLLVQALAGLARAGDGPQALAEARHLFEHRERFNFSTLWTCDDATSQRELDAAGPRA